MRRGAAQVYAVNLYITGVREVCLARLTELVRDDDVLVRQIVSTCFERLREEDFSDVRAFTETFIALPVFVENGQRLLHYLKGLVMGEPELVLSVAEHVLDVVGTDTGFRNTVAPFESDVVALALGVYTHTRDTDLKSRAMDLFERLLTMGSSDADRALQDWDRR